MKGLKRIWGLIKVSGIHETLYKSINWSGIPDKAIYVRWVQIGTHCYTLKQKEVLI